jgi:hypothetical protein
MYGIVCSKYCQIFFINVPPIGGTPYIPLIKKAFPKQSGGNTIFPLTNKRKRNLKIFKTIGR